MKFQKLKLKSVVWLCLTTAILYTAWLILYRKHDLEIGDRSETLQMIEARTDVVSLKRTAKMKIDFLYNVHESALDLWKVSAICGALNVALLTYGASLLKDWKKEEASQPK